MKGYRIVNLKRFICVIAIITATAMLSVFCISFAHSENSYSVCEFTVCEGDTLWGIAELYTDDSIDIREYIREIKKLNGMGTAELMPGDVIIIPIIKGGEGLRTEEKFSFSRI